MKKTHLIIAVLAATIMISSIPLHAREGRIRRATRIAKEKATKQLDESLDRFKRCIKLQCTRWEALKAGRDVIIAVSALIAAMYGTGTALQIPYREYQGLSQRPKLEKALSRTGEALKYPGRKLGEAAGKAGAAAEEQLQKLGVLKEEKEW